MDIGFLDYRGLAILSLFSGIGALAIPIFKVKSTVNLMQIVTITGFMYIMCAHILELLDLDFLAN